MAKKTIDAIDDDDTDFVFFIFCSLDGTNDGTINDTGRLQGAVISSFTSAKTGTVTIVSEVQTAVTVKFDTTAAVSYSANTVVTMKVNAFSSSETSVEITCTVTLDDARVLDQTMIIPVKAS